MIYLSSDVKKEKERKKETNY